MRIRPMIIESFDDYYLLWFSKSNTYSCVDNDFYLLVDSFIKSTDPDSFHKQLKAKGFTTPIPPKELQESYNRIEDFLVKSNMVGNNENEDPQINIPKFNFDITKRYIYNTKVFEVSYGSEHIQDLTHPIIAHLECSSNTDELKNSIKIVSSEDRLTISYGHTILGSFPQEHYHKLQGKFLMLIINIIHDKTEPDWIGLLHASAVTKNNQGILCIGNSGNGKSTLVSILAAKGYALLADDAVPLAAKDLQIYKNPAAVSIKPSSIDVIKEFWPIKPEYTSSYLNSSKGKVTYIPMQSEDEKQAVACKTVVRVNYKKGSIATLKPLDFRKALEFIIPESWLAPEFQNAQRFFSWLSDLEFFELTYSDYNDAIPLLDKLVE